MLHFFSLEHNDLFLLTHFGIYYVPYWRKWLCLCYSFQNTISKIFKCYYGIWRWRKPYITLIHMKYVSEVNIKIENLMKYLRLLDYVKNLIHEIVYKKALKWKWKIKTNKQNHLAETTVCHTVACSIPFLSWVIINGSFTTDKLFINLAISYSPLLL